MFSVTAKVLLFRYLCMMRQRWMLTTSYMMFPLILCLLAASDYESVQLMSHENPIKVHNEESLLCLPKCKFDECWLYIVVNPAGAEERELIERAAEFLRVSNVITDHYISIAYEDDPKQMESIPVSSMSDSFMGVLFQQITPTKLEYTIRARAANISALLYDWSNYATDQEFPSPMYRGPRLTDPYFNVEGEIGKLKTTIPGLLLLQVAIDKAYMEAHFPNVSNRWTLTSFPYPPYTELPETLRHLLSHRALLLSVQFYLTAGIPFMAMVFASYIIHDKASGIREWLCMYGAPRFMINISWLLSFTFEATLLAILEVGIFKLPTKNGPAIAYMSAIVLSQVLMVYNFKTLCWVYLLATSLNNRVICVLIIAACWFFTPLLQWIPPDHFVLQGALATLPNAGMVLIFMSFHEFDGAETVLDIYNLYTFPIHYLPVGILLLIMFFTSILLVLLGMYVDLVKPGKYGRARPWNPFSKREKDQGDGGNETLPDDGSYIEPISDTDPVAFECVRISKFFDKHKALDNINMKIMKNKITVLLGHNGAGKTTLLSILCGLFSPTKGQFRTGEYDVFQGDNIKKFRRVMGYCPQYNWFMDELTIKQHFLIFALLKGLSREAAEEYCTAWTARLGMKKFLKTKASKLSGGNKRKLCLAIAMIGNPQYLLLDEPSSSLDAQSTRAFWGVLQQEKANCSVILTTHDMDEADVLGDRIAFMVGGQLKGYGSSSFLKQKLKIGHKLTCSINKVYTGKLIQLVENFDSSSKLLHQTNHTVTFGFPTGKSEIIPNLMRKIESEFGDGITVSLSYASIDEVFLKMQPEVDTRTSTNGGNLSSDYVELLRMPEAGEPSWSFGWIKEVFIKKMKWTWTHKTPLIVFLVVLPIIGASLAMYTVNNAMGEGSSSENSTDLKLTMDKYRGSRAFIASGKTEQGERITSALRQAMMDSGIDYDEVNNSMVDHLNEEAKKNLFEFRSKNVFAFDAGEVSGSPTAYYSRNAFHSAPIAYSALINAMLHGNASIVTHNFPIASPGEEASCSKMNPSGVSLLFCVIFGPVLLISGSYFILFPHAEKRTFFKHLQLMAGLQPAFYWISHLMFDILTFTLSLSLIIAILAVMDYGLFLDSEVMMALLIALLLYGVSIIVFAYACSFCECSISTIVILFVSIHPLVLIVYFPLKLIFLGFNFPLSFSYLYILPWMILMGSLEEISLWAAFRRECTQCNRLASCVLISENSLFPSLMVELMGFFICAMVYFAIVVAMDYGFGRKFRSMVDRMLYRGIEYTENEVDPKVAQEKVKVEDLRMEMDEYSQLVCDGLGKKYSGDSAVVRNVTFAAESGEIFGLLGTNGAGKTTTFGMLSGLIGPTQGSATVKGEWELGDCEYKYIRNVGYCPQFYGILPGLSGRYTLRLFGRLRGLTSPLLDSRVALWLRALDMEAIADVPCENYSGGNQRKLSFAIAMMGCPPVVLLDEPTSSIDPVIRRRIWDILMTSLKTTDQAIILTSHTMSECETVCDRLTIMADGEMQCLDSVPALKNKFGKSCILLVKLKYDTTIEQMDNIQSKILHQSQFSGYAELSEQQPNLLNIKVSTEKIKTYDVFAEMLKIKEKAIVIEEFSLIDTPLEDVFNKFAQKKGTSRSKRSRQGRPISK